MSSDLFGREQVPTYSSSNLLGPLMAVGRTCPECLKALVETPSGYRACPIGHGRLIVPKDARQLKMGGTSIPVWVKGTGR